MLIHFIATFFAILVGAYVIPGVSVTLLSTVVLAVLLGVINLFIKPILRILTLPLTVLTFGLFAVVLNALILLGLSQVVPDFILSGFWIACIFSILVSLVSSFFALVLRGS